jgi:hypothetical protein
VTSVHQGEVRVELSRAAIQHLPLLPHPEAQVAETKSYEQLMNASAGHTRNQGFLATEAATLRRSSRSDGRSVGWANVPE